MEEYPKNLMDLERSFATEDACREYLCRLRWPQGFRCPACDHAEAWTLKGGLLKCRGCGHKASVIAGTIFEGTRKPLVLWFRAIWWVTSQKKHPSEAGSIRTQLRLDAVRQAYSAQVLRHALNALHIRARIVHCN